MLGKLGTPDEVFVIAGSESGELHLEVVPSDKFDPDTRAEIVRNTLNCRVGNTLVSQSDRVRIWQISMQPGDRLEFHRHVLDYFWTTTAGGRARSRYADGRVVEANYEVGSTKNYRIERGGTFMHDLENIGETVLEFVTVEFLDSANAPLALPEEILRS